MGGFILVRRARPEVVPGAWLAPWQPGRRALEDSVLLAHAPPGDAGAGVLAPRRGLDVIDDARFREVEEGTGRADDWPVACGQVPRTVGRRERPRTLPGAGAWTSGAVNRAACSGAGSRRAHSP